MEMAEDEKKPHVKRSDGGDAVGEKRRKVLRGPSSRPNKYDFPQGLMAKHRQKLTRMLRTFYDDHNWKDCAAVLSVLLQLTPERISGYTLMDFRKNFLIAMELLSRCEETKNHTTKVKQICETWMSKIKWTSDCSKERQCIQLELVLFFMVRGNFSEAHHMTKFLVQDHESASEPKVHLLHGLMSYQIWYSALPVEMQLKDFDMQAPLHTPTTIFNNDVFHLKDSLEFSDYHHATKKQETLSTYYDSDSSVDNKKQVFMGNKYHHNNVFHQTLQVNVQGMNGSSQTNEDRNQLSNPDKNISIFDPHGVGSVTSDNLISQVVVLWEMVPPSHDCTAKLMVDAWHLFVYHLTLSGLDASLLPIQLGFSTEDIEQRIHSHRELLTENFTDAVRHLRTALYSDPPLLAALLPLVQVLLLGDQVGEALKELTKFCHLSKTALPFRLKARLLESFCNNEFVEISICHETVLRREPTCSYSIERLIKMFQDGNYSSLNLLEMIALHLDATTGNCDVWDGFASCLLSMQTVQQSGNQQDRLSGNQTSQNPLNSCSFTFLKPADKQSWQLRSRWWSMRHFSKKILLLEIQAGSWQLITFKAACASHLYGSSSVYVRDVLGTLMERDDAKALSFLDRHMINPLLIFKPSPMRCNIPVPVPRFARGSVDPAWAYGTPVGGDKKKPKCNYCGKMIGGAGITRLKQHLAGGYSEVKMCQQCPENVRNKVRELLRGSNWRQVKQKKEES